MKIGRGHNFLDYGIFAKQLIGLPQGSSLTINTLNQYSYCIAEEDELYKEALQHSDVLLPDGIGIVLAAWFLNGTKLKKIAGADVHCHFLDELEKVSGSCFYLGSSDRTLKLIKKKMALRFPNIRVGSFSPPYRAAFSKAENQQMVNAVNDFAPDVLFVGMTAPKQEKWVHAHRDQLDVRVVCTIGAVFDFYAGVISRPGKLWINLGLEWLGRWLREPLRLSRRYLYYGPVFIFLMIKAKLKHEFS